jgi:hypothetical protein
MASAFRGISMMLAVNASMAWAVGSRSHLAASSHGSFPRRASADSIVSLDPLISSPISARRNAFRREFFRVKTSDRDMGAPRLRFQGGAAQFAYRRQAYPEAWLGDRLGKYSAECCDGVLQSPLAAQLGAVPRDR